MIGRRWVNISYVFTVSLYFHLYKSNIIILSEKVKTSQINIILYKKIFIYFYNFCFGWNPKTVMTGDVATNPLWKIPYKLQRSYLDLKILEFFQDSPLSIWHKKYIE